MSRITSYNVCYTKLLRNLYGLLTRSGNATSETYYAQNNFGMNFDLDKFVKGLSASAYVTFDVANDITTGKSLAYARFV